MMVGLRSRHKLHLLPALALLAATTAADARRLQAEVARVEVAGFVAEDVVLGLDWPEGAETGALVLAARRLRSDALGYDLRDPRWTCTLVRAADGSTACSGQARARGLGAARLKARRADGASTVSLSREAAEFVLELPAGEGDVALRARALPAGWLQPLLAGAWPEARFTGGTLRADLALQVAGSGPVRLSGSLSTQALGLDTDDGRIAAAGLGLDAELDLSFGDEATGVTVDAGLRGGELLAGPFYAALPAEGARLRVVGDGRGGAWQFPQLRFEDPGALLASGSLSLDTGASSTLQALALQFDSADLARATTRYLSGVLGMAGLGDLALSGSLEGALALTDGALQQVDATLRTVAAADADGRFAVSGLEGTAGWRREGQADGTLRWDSAQLYALPLGATTLAWRSANAGLALREPAAIPFFEGRLRFERLAWKPAATPSGDAAFNLALQLDGVELQGLTRALDWPAFAGTLSGRIPEARYEDGVLLLDGGLDMQVFDGRVAVGALRMERAFGVAPTLATDIRLHNLDLVPLTGAFGFGEISGRLEGRIAGLRLVDWEPVAFDADLRTSTSAPDRRRISQRAVSDLSSVGGSGLAGGLQAQLLAMFDTFPYKQIGLSCRLENNICTMGGLGPAGDSGGYTIVEGSGLPHITVVGHQRRVDWPVLVARLEAATSGQAPVVD